MERHQDRNLWHPEARQGRGDLARRIVRVNDVDLPFPTEPAKPAESGPVQQGAAAKNLNMNAQIFDFFRHATQLVQAAKVALDSHSA